MIGTLILIVFTASCMLGFVAALASIRTFWQERPLPGMPADLRHHIYDQDGDDAA